MTPEPRFITNRAKQTLKDGGPLLVFNVFESIRPQS